MSTTTKSKLRSTSNESSDASLRYADDFYGWVRRQVELLRTGRLTEIDAGNIAEELSDVGEEQYDKLESALRVLLLHLLKWDHQPTHRSRSWVFSIQEQRRRIMRVLRKNPSLKSHRDEAVNEGYEDAVADAAGETGLAETTFPATCPYSWAEITIRVIEFDDVRSPKE